MEMYLLQVTVLYRSRRVGQQPTVAGRIQDGPAFKFPSTASCPFPIFFPLPSSADLRLVTTNLIPLKEALRSILCAGRHFVLRKKMRPLSSLGIGLSLVSGCLVLAFVAELYYLFWWKKRTNRDIEGNYRSPAKELLHLFCWKKPSSLSSTALNPQHIPTSVDVAAYSDEGQLQLRSNSGKDLLLKPFGGEDTMEAELMRLHCLAGPPRFLFTIKEETKEDLESEDGRSRGGRSRKGSRGKSLSDLFVSSDNTPFLTPLSSPPFFTPPLTPLDCYKQNGFNPLFESSKEEDFIRLWSSPPPKFKFLMDAEEKLHGKKLMEEASKVHRNGRMPNNMARQDAGVSSHPTSIAASHAAGLEEEEEEQGSFITIVIEKNRDRGQQHHSSSSQVIPLPSSPSSIRTLQGKLSSWH